MRRRTCSYIWIISFSTRSKEGIVEYLAVQQLRQQADRADSLPRRPPGVWERPRLGQVGSRVRRGVNIVRMSLGGVRDEPEIRVLRRTYIGSLPGKIIQSMRKAKTITPHPARRDRQDGPGLPW